MHGHVGGGGPESAYFYVVGYHGTTLERARRIETNGFNWRERRGDWLGGGVYFWQDAPNRAWDWARSIVSRVEAEHPELGNQQPSVIRAEILLTPWRMDLIDLSPWQDRLRSACQVLSNLDALPSQTLDIAASALHPRDHAVITLAAKMFAVSRSVAFDAGRAAFIEGAPLFEQSALFDRAHVQIVVRDLSLITNISRLRETGES